MTLHTNEMESWSSVFLGHVQVVTDPVTYNTQTKRKIVFFHVEYKAKNCPSPKKYAVMLGDGAADAPVTKGCYISISGGEFVISPRAEDRDCNDCIAVKEPKQIDIVVHDGGIVKAEEIM